MIEAYKWSEGIVVHDGEKGVIIGDAFFNVNSVLSCGKLFLHGYYTLKDMAEPVDDDRLIHMNEYKVGEKHSGARLNTHPIEGLIAKCVGAVGPVHYEKGSWRPTTKDHLKDDAEFVILYVPEKA